MYSLKKGATLQETVIWTRRGQNSRKKGQMAFSFILHTRAYACFASSHTILNLESRYFPHKYHLSTGQDSKRQLCCITFYCKNAYLKIPSIYSGKYIGTKILARYQACDSIYEINTSPINIRFVVQPESRILNPVLWLVGQPLYW